MPTTKIPSKNIIKILRRIAHSIKPVITIGNNGVTDRLMEELTNSLKYHELLKIRINSDDKEIRKQIINEVTTSTNSQLIQTIGKVFVIYLANAKNPKIDLK